MSEITQEKLLMEYFKKHPNKDVPHPEIVDWVTAKYTERTGEKFRDPDRGIRKLHQGGILIKVKKGVYRYEHGSVKKRQLEDFTPAQKEEIFKRDGYKCVMCGKGRKEGMEIHADHIIPKDKGGKATIENGQTLCSQHNFLKKNLNQTETGKKMYIHLYELTKSKNEKVLFEFCKAILEIYEKFGINGHIVWKK